jgi:hypothetical protein
MASILPPSHIIGSGGMVNLARVSSSNGQASALSRAGGQDRQNGVDLAKG